MNRTTNLQRRTADLAKPLNDELEPVDDAEADSWPDAVENRAVAISDAIAAELVSQQVAARQPDEHEADCPDCHQTGRYVGDRPRELLGRRGPINIAEPKYYCPGCRRDFFPSDPSTRRRT